jgi:hypothetical protein
MNLSLENEINLKNLFHRMKIIQAMYEIFAKDV